MRKSGRRFKVGTTVQERFWARVDKSGDCWLWTGYRMPDGYGRVSLEWGQMRLTHRLSYEWAFGEIPNGMYVCHHCDNPACVRPDHLFIGTQQDNMSDASRKNRIKSPLCEAFKSRTHCKHGHEYTVENTYIKPNDSARCCRECLRQHQRDLRARRRAA